MRAERKRDTNQCSWFPRRSYGPAGLLLGPFFCAPRLAQFLTSLSAQHHSFVVAAAECRCSNGWTPTRTTKAIMSYLQRTYTSPLCLCRSLSSCVCWTRETNHFVAIQCEVSLMSVRCGRGRNHRGEVVLDLFYSEPLTSLYEAGRIGGALKISFSPYHAQSDGMYSMTYPISFRRITSLMLSNVKCSGTPLHFLLILLGGRSAGGTAVLIAAFQMPVRCGRGRNHRGEVLLDLFLLRPLTSLYEAGRIGGALKISFSPYHAQSDGMYIMTYPTVGLQGVCPRRVEKPPTSRWIRVKGNVS
ncbi:hypothetical protein K438DRAFT_451888 [Mycena galopus ATCC 62051]|nr:hypothetical protein K438DRAFT_451888 [Mycena galopus ATCC 62051]